MKKTVSVILAAILLVSSLCVAAGAADASGISFAVASDLHYNRPEETLTWYSEDPVFGYANRRAAMENESGLIIDEFLRQCAEDDAIEFVLITGDMADNGKTIKEEHLDVAEKFRKFESETGKQIYVIDGNHDLGVVGGTCVTGIEEFKEIYAEFGYDKALEVCDDCSYTADLGEGYRLIALDSCDPSVSTEDGMSAAKLSWVLDKAAEAKADGRQPILMMHHNLLDHLPLQRILSHDFIVRFHYTTAELFADAGIKLVFTGHEHCSDTASYTSGYGNTIYDFATTSLTMYPLQFRFIELTDDAINYSVKTVDKIDTAALAASVDGYSQEQLDAMDAGLNAFAKEYLKNGVEYRLELSLSEEKLGVSPDSPFYDLVMTAVGGLLDVCNMPLYGEDSIQSLGAQYGIEIPDSEYKDGWDLAMEFVAAHYAGSEAFDIDGTELTILLRTVDIILKTDLPNVADETLLGAANLVFSSFGLSPVAETVTKKFCNEFGSVTPGEKLLLAIASPLLAGFACDDEVDDNIGTLEGYGPVIAEEYESEETGVMAILESFLLKIENIFHYILRLLDIIR